MVDPEAVSGRLRMLAQLLAELEATRGRGQEVYRAQRELRLATERRLQLALQACIDIAAHVLAERNVPAPEDYASLFFALAQAGVLESELAGRLAGAARQRNLLVHVYLEVDDDLVWRSLTRLDDLRAFAAAMARLLEQPAA
jgi:uncharacterized protein YutE (UPF0331/DUF86 family)